MIGGLQAIRLAEREVAGNLCGAWLVSKMSAYERVTKCPVA